MSSVQTFDEIFVERRGLEYYEPSDYFKDIFNKTMILMNELLPNDKPKVAFYHSRLTGSVTFLWFRPLIIITEYVSDQMSKSNIITYEISYFSPAYGSKIMHYKGSSDKNDAWFEEFCSHLKTISELK